MLLNFINNLIIYKNIKVLTKVKVLSRGGNKIALYEKKKDQKLNINKMIIVNYKL